MSSPSRARGQNNWGRSSLNKPEIGGDGLILLGSTASAISPLLWPYSGAHSLTLLRDVKGGAQGKATIPGHWGEQSFQMGVITFA